MGRGWDKGVQGSCAGNGSAHDGSEGSQGRAERRARQRTSSALVAGRVAELLLPAAMRSATSAAARLARSATWNGHHKRADVHTHPHETPCAHMLVCN
jgi:hypothetical protein